MRGKPAKVGDEKVSQNGYTYVRTETGWRLKHHVLAEERLGRVIAPNERVSFLDGDRTNLDPKNIIVHPKSKVNIARQLARVNDSIGKLHELRELLETELGA